MKRIVSPDLIRDYLSGRCTPEQAAQLREWYDSFAHDPDPMDALSSGERAALKEMMFKEVLQRLGETEARQPRESFIVKRRHFFLGAAAAAVLLFFGARVLFDNAGRDTAKLSAEAGSDKPAAVQHSAVKEVKIENQGRTIRREVLSDGSIVWLQPDTWLAFSATFQPEKREVRMSGEAFFEVSPDVNRPFIVYSGDLVTRVLGTSFNVKAYKNSASAEVSVFTGQVSVSLPSLPGKSGEAKPGKNELLLVKDEKAVFSQREKLLKKQVYNVKKEPELNIWKKNTISFDNTPVKEVVKALNEEFGVSLQVAASDPQLNDYLLKADFTSQNLPDILQMLETSLSLTYEIEGNKIVLKLDK